MAEGPGGVVNPLLELVTSSEAKRVKGRSKDASKIDSSIYQIRSAALLSALDDIEKSPDAEEATHAGCILLWARMAPLSIAASHTPDDLFDPRFGTQIIAAWQNGYVIEFQQGAVQKLKERIAHPTNPQKCDIFRLDGIEVFAQTLLNSGWIEAAWAISSSIIGEKHLINVRLPYFSTADARISVAMKLETLALNNDIALATSAISAQLLLDDRQPERDLIWAPNSILREHAEKVSFGDGYLPLGISSSNALSNLVKSGAIVRWEPLARLQPTTPGAGPEPEPRLPSLEGHPIVGVIDGGYHGTRYRAAVAWTMNPPLTLDADAAKLHGNQVASLVVDAHLWSNQLDLPKLHCRIGVVQAVPDVKSTRVFTDNEIIRYVNSAFETHPETHVWNLSANRTVSCHEFEVSELGHGLSQLSRLHNKLLVISAGNCSQPQRIAPPADCSAAIVVTGRQQDMLGRVANACDISRGAFGPEDMLKPDLSWFSQHRVAGGVLTHGTSFAAPLVARLAAHAWENLRNPSPDLVRAILIGACDLPKYQRELGFGSPINPELPWTCADNAVSIAWTGEIQAYKRYSWRGIRVPPSLIKNGRLHGSIKLIAILDPITQSRGHHYYSTRLETNLYCLMNEPSGPKFKPFMGCINPKEKENIARQRDRKWDPLRVYRNEFKSNNAQLLIGPQPTLEVGARVYWRNEFQYSEDYRRNHISKVTFLLILESFNERDDTYNEFRRIMGNDVRTALVEQAIEVDEANSVP